MSNLDTESKVASPNINTDCFGWELILDLYQCNPSKVRSRDEILTFMHQLCSQVLDMKCYGEPIIARFGEHRAVNMGYSIVQLVETSSVSAHFSELKNAAYLEIFSCKPFDPADVRDFCRDFFDAQSIKDYFLERL